jgi:2-amino-4-hydroxy-6-hydroxymethyldihydropteridine diphosphokinase/tRNA threonylcarbamoyl adenosine modification protein YjeE
MKAERLAAIGLGSNIEPRRVYLDRAIAAIDALPGTSVRGVSRLWRSKGWGLADLEPFLNAVAVVTTTLEPHALLVELRAIEDANGRQRTIKWGPRTLDLDLLACDDLTIDDSVLQLPHPWIARRPFVYLPWREVLDLRPEWGRLLEPNPPEAVGEEQDSSPILEPDVLWGRRAEATHEAMILGATEEQTQEVGARLALWLRAGDLVFLEGRMGAGKSVIARGIARGLGITGPIQSPTYTLCRRYESGRTPLEHWDLYRLGSPDELVSCGYEPPDVSAIRVVEWASLFPHDAGKPTLGVELSVLPDDSRRIRLTSTHRPLPFSIRVLHG